MNDTRTPLSVVVAITGRAATIANSDASEIPAWLSAARTAAAAADADLFLVGSARHLPPSRGSREQHLIAPDEALVPLLWSLGFRRAKGQHIAITIDEVIVTREWAERGRRALDAGVAATGGPLELSPECNAAGRALYFLRYHAFLPRGTTGPQPAREVAGDNGFFHAQSVIDTESLWQHGVWDVELTRALRARHAPLTLDDALSACFDARPALIDLLRMRFAHGRTSGAIRAAHGARGPVGAVLAIPAVPFVLLWRAWRAVRSATPALSPSLIGVAPLVLLLGLSWSVGEAWGACAGLSRQRNVANTHR